MKNIYSPKNRSKNIFTSHFMSVVLISNHDAKLLDQSQIPVIGKLTIDDQVVSFSPSADEDQQISVAFNKSEVKYISFMDIGYRSENGPFFEISFYLKDQGRLYSFSEFMKSVKEDFGAFFQNKFGITPVDK